MHAACIHEIKAASTATVLLSCRPCTITLYDGVAAEWSREGGWQSLNQLSLSINRIAGSLPGNLGEVFSQLQLLDVSNNQINQQLPSGGFLLTYSSLLPRCLASCMTVPSRPLVAGQAQKRLRACKVAAVLKLIWAAVGPTDWANSSMATATLQLLDISEIQITGTLPEGAIVHIQVRTLECMHVSSVSAALS